MRSHTLMPLITFIILMVADYFFIPDKGIISISFAFSMIFLIFYIMEAAQHDSDEKRLASKLTALKIKLERNEKHADIVKHIEQFFSQCSDHSLSYTEFCALAKDLIDNAEDALKAS